MRSRRLSIAMRCAGRVLPMLVVVCGTAMSALDGTRAEAAGTDTAPLTLEATCDARGETPLLHVQIANRSDRTTTVVLGFTAEDGRTRVVNAVQVVAIRQTTGADEAYVYVDPRYALATPEPAWIESLAPGATRELELPLHDFISTLNYSSLEPDVAGGARLVLDGRPADSRPAPVWTGTVETVVEPCRY
jgi:hypothetical protein